MSGRPTREPTLAAAITAVAEHRRVELTTLQATLNGMDDLAQSRWEPWRRNQRLTASTPEMFAELLESVSEFADPVLDGTVTGATRKTTSCTWVRD